MRISIFSKFDMAGGSEHRCVELANGISRFTEHESFILAEKNVPEKLLNYSDKKVNIIENCFLTPEYIYNSDYIIIVNTDASEFSTLDYWRGKSHRHSFSLDIDKMKKIKLFFLYNFIVSPARHLEEFKNNGIDVGIITTNNNFFEEITKQDRYEAIRMLPRYVLTSPIDQNKLKSFIRGTNETICFGMHSKKLDNKWNDEIEKLIHKINDRYKNDKIKFRFMGMKKELKEKIKDIPNVVCLNENEEDVGDFLSQLDVFLFFPDWKREEPWARVIAEAMVSGCPVVALDRGGTKDQVLQHNNGFLCKNFDDYYKSVVYLIEHKQNIREFSKNSLRISKNFYTEFVIKKMMDIIMCYG